MSLKFEDTQLLQHAEVKNAYDLYLKEVVPLDDHYADMVLNMATTLSQFGANNDPHLVAASLMFPYYMENATNKTYTELSKTFDVLTLEYMNAQLAMMHPMGIVDIFPDMPATHQRAAVSIVVALELEGLRDMQANLSQMSKSELKEALRDGGDPVMPSLGQLVEAVDLRTHEPKLMGAYDALRQSLLDIANGKKPAAPKATATPKP